MTTEELPTVQHVMVEAMKKIGAVGKDGRNAHQNFSFRGIDSVVNAVSPAFQKLGIVVTPELQKIERREMRTAKGNAMNSIEVIVKYTFTGPRGDSVSATVPGEAFDSGDKATAKAMSVAFRIALLQALALPTHDTDPDEESFAATPYGQPMTNRQAAQQQGGQSPQQRPQPAQGGQYPHAPQGQFDPQAALQQVWDSPQGLAGLRKHVAKIEGVPQEYLVTIRNREQELANNAPQQ